MSYISSNNLSLSLFNDKAYTMSCVVKWYAGSVEVLRNVVVGFFGRYKGEGDNESTDRGMWNTCIGAHSE